MENNTNTYIHTVHAIILMNEKLYEFWSKADGWAPNSAANLLKDSRLDWQVSLSKSLNNWVEGADEHCGNLILAWANLGALVEGTLKLFLCVFLEDYSNDEFRIIKKKDGSLIIPDVLKLENLKTFVWKKKLIDRKQFDFIRVWTQFNQHLIAKSCTIPR